MSAPPSPGRDLASDIEAICGKLRQSNAAVAETIEQRVAGGATSTEVLMGVSGELSRAVFKEKGIPLVLRKDMLVLSWRIDRVVKRI